MPSEMGAAGSDPGFLDDFYTECDEHLMAIRRTLGQLEADSGKRAADPNLWQSLFRPFHSLKGVLGLAGLAGPERLAHRAEDFLRALSRGEMVLDESGLDTLAAVVQGLERALAAHRQHQPQPELAPLLERLQRQRPQPQPEAAQPSAPPGSTSPWDLSGADPAIQERLRSAQQAGKRVWRCLFVPSPELHQRGININAIRSRLQAAGDILLSTPKVEANNAISFEFLVASEQDLVATLQAAEGLHVQPVALPAAPAEPAAASAGSAAPAAATTAPAYVAPSHIVRVDLSRLDELMRVMGEMVRHRARLEDLLARVDGLLPPGEARSLQEVNYGLARELRRLREGLMRVRLVPIAEIFDRMSLVVRDLAREQGRKIQLRLQGQETQIDKYIVERLKEPLLHLVRNAVAHGLEAPATRVAAGKPEALNIRLSASTVGETVLIEVTDDGQGIDPAQVRERALQAGLTPPESLDGNALLELLCWPGFSTKETADLGAGRGVGMAVVKETLTQLGGEIALDSTPGRGTTFTLRVPLTLAVTDALLIGVSDQKFALPQTGLQEITTISAGAIQRLEKTEFMRYRQGVLPLVRLAQLFGLPGAAQAEYPVLVVGHGRERLGVLAERVFGQREIMVRALSDPLFKIPAVSGATELGDGRAVLILDALGLMQVARQGRDGKRPANGRAGLPAEQAQSEGAQPQGCGYGGKEYGDKER